LREGVGGMTDGGVGLVDPGDCLVVVEVEAPLRVLLELPLTYPYENGPLSAPPPPEEPAFDPPPDDTAVGRQLVTTLHLVQSKVIVPKTDCATRAAVEDPVAVDSDVAEAYPSSFCPQAQPPKLPRPSLVNAAQRRREVDPAEVGRPE
jgi:hypothetical protein